MNKVGIVCATDTELKPFLPHITGRKTVQKALLRFHEGLLRQTPVVAVYSGVCKVNAAIATQILIDCFHVNAILNTGVAGGIDNRLRVFDTVISEQSAYHDVEETVLTEGHPWMPSMYFPSSDKLLDIARQYAALSNHPLYFGHTVTGEQFIEEERRQELQRRFRPLSVDMETASVAHVCYANSVPFLSIRTLSDTAKYDGMEHYEANATQASFTAGKITMDLIERIGTANL